MGLLATLSFVKFVTCHPHNRGYSLYPHGTSWVLAELPNGRRTYLPAFQADGDQAWTMYSDAAGHEILSEGNQTHHRRYASDFFEDTTAPPKVAGQAPSLSIDCFPNTSHNK